MRILKYLNESIRLMAYQRVDHQTQITIHEFVIINESEPCELALTRSMSGGDT